MDTADLSRLERWGLNALAAHTDEWPNAENPVHVLDAAERSALVRIERGAILRAGFAGAVSAGVCTLAIIGLAPDEAQDVVGYWSVVGVASALTAVVEIAYLYWDAVRSVRAMARASGVKLYAGDTLQRVVALALTRAALELPQPYTNALRVDPFRESPRWRVLVATLVYKAKIALTGFVTKALLRRALGRLATRAALEAVAIPVTAVWNMIVCRWVMREARLRAMGPSLARDLAPWIRAIDGQDANLELVAWALGTSIVKNRKVHPNWVALVDALDLPQGLRDATRDFSDCARFLAALKAASAVDRRAALRALVAAAILDGKVTRLERAWLEVTFTVAGYTFADEPVAVACKDFAAGNGFEPVGLQI